MFAYLADVVKSRNGDAVDIWNVVKQGYLSHPHTDLVVPYSDVADTQLVWLNANEHVAMDTMDETVQVILNILFRWHIATIELMRKMLSFCDYCRSLVDGSFDDKRLVRLLYRNGDPTSALLNSSDTVRGANAVRFYEKEMRNALAHGNFIMSLPYSITVRFCDAVNGQFSQKRYEIQNGSGGIDELIANVHDPADRCFQSIRIFFFIYSTIESRYKTLIGKTWDEYNQDPSLADTVRSALRSKTTSS